MMKLLPVGKAQRVVSLSSHCVAEKTVERAVFGRADRTTAAALLPYSVFSLKKIRNILSLKRKVFRCLLLGNTRPLLAEITGSIKRTPAYRVSLECSCGKSTHENAMPYACAIPLCGSIIDVNNYYYAHVKYFQARPGHLWWSFQRSSIMSIPLVN